LTVINENTLHIAGKIVDFRESHSYKQKNFYELTLEVDRLSEIKDILSFIVPEDLLFRNDKIQIDKYIEIFGEVRMINRNKTEKHNIHVFGYVDEYKILSEEDYKALEEKNYVKLEGYVCKPPRERVTNKTHRKITDLLIANNRTNRRSYYIPAIAWGNLSKMASKFVVGDKIIFEGRFQSRCYENTDENGNVIKYSVSEVSAVNIAIAEK